MRKSLIHGALLVLLFSLSLFLPPAVTAAEARTRVLIFSSDDHFIPANTLVNQTIRSIMRNGSPAHIEFFYEAQDSFRIASEKYETELVELFRRKYEGEGIDIIYALGPPALRFLLKHRSEIFSKTPIVFVALDQKRLIDLDLSSNITGVTASVELKPTMDLALVVQPDIKNVVVIGGKAPIDSALVEQAHRELPAYEGRIEFTYLIGLSIEDLKKKLSELPPRSIIFYLSMTSDNAEKLYYNPDVLAALTPLAKGPIYGVTQPLMGSGIIGGRLINFEAIGTRAAEVGVRILSGERPESIPLQIIPNTTMFDWRELRRWGIDENRLPADAVLRYRQPTFWELYKWRIVGAISVITLQALLIVWLFLNKMKRRQAEVSLRASEQRLRLGLQAGRMIAWDWDPSIDKVNTVGDLNEIYGTDSITEGNSGFSLLHPEDLTQHQSIVNKALNNGGAYQSEFRIIRSDNGAVVWLEERGEAVFNGDGKAHKVTGVVMDITERRRSEEALRVSESRFRIMADSAPVMIWLAGPDQQCSYFNQGWLKFTGRTIDDELGTGWTDIVCADDYARFLDTYDSAFKARKSFQVEFRMRRADGVYRWIYDCGTPRFSSDGEFLGYIGSCIDISDRKEVEDALLSAHAEVNKLKDQLEAENVYLQEEIKLAHHVTEIIGESAAIKYVLFKIEQVSQTDSTVLILGETGTGKELVARAIHNQSTRKDRPLVKVNCAALSASLIESELFGHEKGAFTGASARKIGRFELADGGTIFLDEIGELPLELQAKLLRVVQEGELERLGGTKTIKVNVRILAATNRNLKVEVENGAFREDLWYRLNVFPLTVPPLRQRSQDILPLVQHFVSMLSKKIGKQMNSISSTTAKKLQSYSWPGNVRELANVIERAVINSKGPVLHITDQFESAPTDLSTSTRTLEEVEKEHIRRTLDETLWRIEGSNGAAKRLGVNASTLRSRMAKLGIQKSLRTTAGNSCLKVRPTRHQNN